ncbi:MAG: tetratricopeptide repeat protein [Rhodanobacteraceae bacterium]|nr:tetratricopeptide repeat protein [Rhodanobacteraceae bacterium]
MREQIAFNDCFLDGAFELASRVIDPLAGTVTWQGQTEHLRRKQLEVLALLASSRGECVSRQQFLKLVWSDNALVGERGLNDTICALRKSLHDEDDVQPLIRTIPRRGYQLSCNVRVLPRSRSSSLAQGQPIPGKPGWQLAKLLGESPVAATWLAEQPAQGLTCVIRFCRSEEHLRGVQREVTLLRYLRESLAGCRRIVRIIDWRLAEPPYYLAMDFVSGGSLATWAKTADVLQQLSIADRLKLIGDLAEALAAVHSAGVVHRNLDASSVLIELSETRPRAKLGGFGRGELNDRHRLNQLAITAAGMDTVAPEALSHQHYLAQELRLGGQPTFETDIYALGVLMLQIASADLDLDPTAEHAPLHASELSELIGACLAEAGSRPSAKNVSARIRPLLSGDDFEPGHENEPEPSVEEVASPTIVTNADQPDCSEFTKRYRIARKLGEGGMGTVYVAEQREPVRRQVAIKIGREGLDDALVLATFERERQALACLNHVNVPTIFDAGFTAKGRPYIAREYVNGLDLLSHCNQSRSSIRERIQLFCQLCDAVTHAHQHGLIHRDIKPANILIRTQGGEPPQVKVIDFGVAKSFQPSPEELEIELQLSASVGTPLYCSPEQLLDQGEAVDTRSDLYSLGVVLFELLAGVTPYSPEALTCLLRPESRPAASLPALPGMAECLSRMSPPQRRELAQARATSPDMHLNQVSGDLGWIVEKCLRRDAAQRYCAVLDLRRDLGHWLDARPIEARPGTARYRLGKWVRRHRMAAGLAGLMLLTLVCTVIAAVVGFIRVGLLLAETRQRLNEAEAAADFRIGQIRSLDPTYLALDLREELVKKLNEASPVPQTAETLVGADAQAIEVLLSRVNFAELVMSQLERNYLQPTIERAATELKNHPDLQARIWQTTGETLLFLNRPDGARQPLERALENWQTLHGADAPQALETVRSLALLDLAAGKLDRAESEARRSYLGLLAALGPRHAQTIVSQEALGKVLIASGKQREGMDQYRAALASRQLQAGLSHVDTIGAELTLAEAQVAAGEWNDAKRALDDLVARAAQQFGDTHPLTVRSRTALAAALDESYQYRHEESVLREAYRGATTTFGPKHSVTLDISNSIANLLRFRGSLIEAARLYREVLRLRVETLGRSHPEALRPESNLGMTLMQLGRLAEAEPLLIHAEAVTRSILGAEHPQALAARRRVGLLRHEQGRLAEAKSIFFELTEVRSRLFGKDDWRTLRANSDVAAVLQDEGDLAAAEALQRQVVASFRAIDFDRDPNALTALCTLGQLLTERGAFDEAEGALQRCLRGRTALAGGAHPTPMLARHALLELLIKSGQIEESVVVGGDLLGAAEKVFDLEDPRFGAMRLTYARALSASGRMAESAVQYDLGWKALKRAGSKGAQLLLEHADEFRSLMNSVESKNITEVSGDMRRIWRERIGALGQGSAGRLE